MGESNKKSKYNIGNKGFTMDEKKSESSLDTSEKSIDKSNKRKGKLLAKKELTISRGEFKVKVKKGDDCSHFSDKFKGILKTNGVI